MSFKWVQCYVNYLCCVVRSTQVWRALILFLADSHLGLFLGGDAEEEMSSWFERENIVNNSLSDAEDRLPRGCKLSYYYKLKLCHVKTLRVSICSI